MNVVQLFLSNTKSSRTVISCRKKIAILVRSIPTFENEL